MTALSRYNPTITVPDGRVFRGRRANTLGDQGEAPYIAALARQVGGIVEVILPAGRADVATETHVFEVEPVGSWRTGAQQAFAYAGMSGLAPALALFGPADYLPIYLRIRDKMPGLSLWAWEDRGVWTRVTNRQMAQRRRGGWRGMSPGISSKTNAVARLLAERIADNHYPTGKLPAASELCAEFGVSATVIRGAVNYLKATGVLEGVPGVGVFVKEKT